MKQHEINKMIDYVLKNYLYYNLNLVEIEIKAFNFTEKQIWYANFIFYENDNKQCLKYFHCGNTPETQNYLEVKRQFIKFCKSFNNMELKNES